MFPKALIYFDVERKKKKEIKKFGGLLLLQIQENNAYTHFSTLILSVILCFFLAAYSYFLIKSTYSLIKYNNK